MSTADITAEVFVINFDGSDMEFSKNDIINMHRTIQSAHDIARQLECQTNSGIAHENCPLEHFSRSYSQFEVDVESHYRAIQGVHDSARIKAVRDARSSTKTLNLTEQVDRLNKVDRLKDVDVRKYWTMREKFDLLNKSIDIFDIIQIKIQIQIQLDNERAVINEVRSVFALDPCSESYVEHFVDRRNIIFAALREEYKKSLEKEQYKLLLPYLVNGMHYSEETIVEWYKYNQSVRAKDAKNDVIKPFSTEEWFVKTAYKEIQSKRDKVRIAKIRSAAEDVPICHPMIQIGNNLWTEETIKKFKAIVQSRHDKDKTLEYDATELEILKAHREIQSRRDSERIARNKGQST